MKKKQFTEFNQLLVTNSISTDSPYWHELDAFIANPTETPPIIVVGVLLDGSGGAYLAFSAWAGIFRD